MSRSIGLANIRYDGGAAIGVFGSYTLRCAFQPIFSFQDDRLVAVAFEGLARPFRDNEPLPTPAFFDALPTPELIQVEMLARTLHILNAIHLPKTAQIFLNFDPSLLSDRFISQQTQRDIKLALHETGIEPQRIVCEMTEKRSASPQTLKDLVAAFRAHGFAIAVDDYGADQSDIERIKALKPDIVKIDGRLVMRLMVTEAGYDLLKNLIRAFHAQGVRTVLEGIEKPWQVEMAIRSGCSMLQGFALGYPQFVPSDASEGQSFGQEAAPSCTSGAGNGSPVTMSSTLRGAPTFGRRIAS